MNVRRLSAPFAVHVALCFGLLLIAAMAAIAWVNDRGVVRLLEDARVASSERIAQRVGLELEALFEPLELSLSLISHHRSNLGTSLPIRMEGVTIFREALLANREAAAFYVAYANGDFFMVRRLMDEAERRLFDVDANVAYVVQSIDGDDEALEGKFVLLDKFANVLGESRRPFYRMQFDPRKRGWYEKAKLADGTIRTDLYLFATTRKVGITFAQKSEIAETVVGADVNIESLSKFISDLRPTRGAEIALINQDGKVVAYKDPSLLSLVSADGRVDLVDLDRFPVEALSSLAGAGAGAGAGVGDQIHREIAGRRWMGTMTPITLHGANRLKLVVAIPEDEILDGVQGVRGEVITVSALILVVAMVLVVLLSFAISRPLTRLSSGSLRLRRFDFSDRFDQFSPVKEIGKLGRSFETLQTTLSSFIRMLNLISQEKELNTLFPVLLNELSIVLHANRAVLYIMPSAHDDIAVAAVKDGDRIVISEDRDPDPIPELVRTATRERGHLVFTGRIEASELSMPGLRDIVHDRSEYQRALVYVLNDRKSDLIGAILFLDCDHSSDGAIGLVNALTGVAAVSLETRQLIESQTMLFDAFIRLIASAIDTKSPHTGGHCARVPELTKMLAQAAVAAKSGPFQDFTLSESDWQAVHVASYLHDCGKITSPEFVIDKATKLETHYDRIHEIRTRFEVLKRDAQIDCLQAILDGADPVVARTALAAAWRDLDEDFYFIAACNEGKEYTSPEEMLRIAQISRRRWLRTLDNRAGVSTAERERMEQSQATGLPAPEFALSDRPEHVIPRSGADLLAPGNRWGFKMDQPEFLYHRGELHNLMVSRGTLTDEERYKINEHIIQTIVMLTALPYPRHLRQVPEIAGGHHERMDGQGYPKRLKRDDMSPVARMMAIADIFEALTAGDRPYKKSKSLSEAIQIMGEMAVRGHIDQDLFEMFLSSGIYRTYAERFIDPEQIDEVPVERYLQPV